MFFFMWKGKLYFLYNGNFLIYGCIFVDENGEMELFEIEGECLSGCELFDVFEYYVRRVFDYKEFIEDIFIDLVWYFWIGKYLFLFGKCVMIMFECYFIEDKVFYKEEKNFYYYLCEDVDMICKMLKDFGFNLDEGCIINGYMFVKEIDGEDLIKVNGKMLVIDGGFLKVY